MNKPKTTVFICLIFLPFIFFFLSTLILQRKQELGVDLTIPTSSALEPLVNNQSSVEYQLQQQVNFYQVKSIKIIRLCV